MTDSSAPSTAASAPQGGFRRGLVKQVLSGDAVVLQGQPTNGPPPETTVYLSQVSAPRLGKRPTEASAGTPDEPYAWEAREWLRKKLVGNVVSFVKDFTATSGRDHGRIYLGGTNVENSENVTKTGVSEGYLEVRQGKVPDEYTTELLALQDAAKAAHKGRWTDEVTLPREVTWVIDNPRNLVDKYAQKPIDAVVEMVRDGSTLRVLLLPSFEYITLQLSGVKAPSTRSVQDSKPEPFAEEAKFFVESRLLQRDIQVILESVSNQNLVGSVLHPKGNIAEYLLRDGYAKCVDWSIGVCTGGAEKLRAAERAAKEKRIRIWKSYAPSASNTGEKKAFNGKAVEVVMNDAIVILKDDGKEVKVHLSSVRLPREQAEDGSKPAAPVGRQFRPLYDIPFMFQAREFLRKRLIGKTVQVVVDYIQPKSEQFPEKVCCTIKLGDLNIAEALVSRGLSKVVRHRNDDENRSSAYDALLAAEANAEKNKKGLFADKSGDRKDTQRIQELAGDAARSKQFLPYLQRGGRNEGVVEFIASGSRLRVYVPKETCLITLLLGGINCPKGPRPGPGGVTGEPEPFAVEAQRFTRSLVMQHEVEFDVEGIDKTGNFIGYLYVRQSEGGRPQNLSELLVEQGLATVHHFSAEKSAHYNSLVSAEIRARNARRNIWANHKEEEAEQEDSKNDDRPDRVVQYKKVAITEVARGALKFFAQHVDDGPKLEKLTAELRDYLRSNPPMTGAYNPKRGDLCVAKYSLDNEWYRAKVESVRAGVADVLFIDYGNRESTAAHSLGVLPREYATTAPFAKEYGLALVSIPNDKDYARTSEEALQQALYSVPTAELNVEYRANGLDYAQVLVDNEGTRTDVGKLLVENGFALFEKRREQRLQQLVSEYQAAENKARRERRNIWEFGDFTGSDL